MFSKKFFVGAIKVNLNQRFFSAVDTGVKSSSVKVEQENKLLYRKQEIDWYKSEEKSLFFAIAEREGKQLALKVNPDFPQNNSEFVDGDLYGIYVDNKQVEALNDIPSTWNIKEESFPIDAGHGRSKTEACSPR